MEIRTDLALERREYIEKRECDGIISSEESENGVTVSSIKVINESGERLIEKPVGTYITLEHIIFSRPAHGGQVHVLKRQLRRLLPKSGCVLIAGLGNEAITPDALGPRCVSQIFATRHIGDDTARSLGLDGLRSVCALAPGVLGQTGMESAQIIRAVCGSVRPSAVIVVDALASRRLSRLGCTVQMADSGIAPGSGVGNNRREISRKTVGVPVIAIGVPTVVDANTLAHDLTPQRARGEAVGEQMMVTPKEIDVVIDRAASFIAMAINLALQPGLTERDINSLVK